MSYVTHVNKNESTAARRRFYFFLVDATDGKTPEEGENGGQPQISIDGAAWTNVGIGTLVHVGGAGTNEGQYYAELTQTAVNIDGPTEIHARYKSANTTEARALNVIKVGDPIANAAALLFNDVVFDRETGALDVYNRNGYAGGAGTKLFTLTPTEVSTNVVKMARS